MSDQQLVTGLSIIISGYFLLNCGMSFYDWRMITNLAWFSSVTHLATLLFLQQYMRRNRYVWYVRVLLMTALAIMLVVGIIPTGATAMLTVPARCLFDSMGDFENPTYHGDWRNFSGLMVSKGKPSMAFSEIVILGGLLNRLLDMSAIMRRLTRLVRTALGRLFRVALIWSCNKLQSSPKLAQALFIPLVVFSLALLISMQGVLDFFRSDISSVSDTIVLSPAMGNH